MLRAVAIFGLGAIFYVISPGIRGDVHNAVGYAFSNMELYAPWSYVAGVMLVLATMVFAFNRGARAR